MKALTVSNPYAWAIAAGEKTIENRSFSRQWRGELAIHAGKGWHPAGSSDLLVRGAWTRHTGHGIHPDSPGLVYGAVLAVADLTDICTVRGGFTDCDCGEWAEPFRCHWRLANVRPLPELVPARGALGLWTLPAEVEQAVRAQLGEAVRHG